ncbi:hypothetical protein AVEN_162820-1 [Araneus ventricosus]|uniref:Uncharacterized protein n=1 Tax=Araneus ventricosus TaxID=182803 RepID=A0A4Y2C7S5_ARAVE|nr:hypothetical protein AVEN_162820-1 [Araneus ventricosus]
MLQTALRVASFPHSSYHQIDSHRTFSLFGDSILPSHPDISSMTLTHIPPPQHRMIYRPPQRIVFHFYTEWNEWKSNNDGIPNSPSVYANYHRDFTLTNGSGSLCSKKSGVEHW